MSHESEAVIRSGVSGVRFHYRRRKEIFSQPSFKYQLMFPVKDVNHVETANMKAIKKCTLKVCSQTLQD